MDFLQVVIAKLGGDIAGVLGRVRVPFIFDPIPAVAPQADQPARVRRAARERVISVARTAITIVGRDGENFLIVAIGPAAMLHESEAIAGWDGVVLDMHDEIGFGKTMLPGEPCVPAGAEPFGVERDLDAGEIHCFDGGEDFIVAWLDVGKKEVVANAVAMPEGLQDLPGVIRPVIEDQSNDLSHAV